MGMHTVGWLNRPTRDGRVIIRVGWRRMPLPILRDGELVGTVVGHNGGADDGALVVWTDYQVPDDHVLSITMGDIAMPEWSDDVDPLANISGTVAGFAVIPRAEWAWQ